MPRPVPEPLECALCFTEGASEREGYISPLCDRCYAAEWSAENRSEVTALARAEGGE